MEMSHEEFISSFSDRELGPLGQKLLQIFRQEIDKRKLKSSGKLQNEAEYHLIKNLSSSAAALGFSFPQHGALLDMKHAEYTRFMPPVEMLQVWVLRKGLRSFLRVPGYQNFKSDNEKTTANRIAWGIAKSNLNRHLIKRRSRGWYTKLIWKHINQTLDKFAQEYADFAHKKVADSI